MSAPFYIRFAICNLVLIFITLGIILVKRVMKNHITVKFQYYLWYAYLILLLLPFLSSKNSFNTIYYYFKTIGMNDNTKNTLANMNSNPASIPHKTSFIKDFALSVNRTDPKLFNSIILVIWIIGIVTLTLITIHNYFIVKKIIKTSSPIQDNAITYLYNECKDKIGIKKNIQLNTSSRLTTPITCGLFYPCVIMPASCLSLSKNDTRNIFLHELQHYKHKDLFINYVMCLFQIIYWFNPLIWYAFKEMRTDREIVCDICVLEMLGKDSYVEYGNTIINFADKVSQKNSLTCVSDIGGSNKQITKRILKIATYQTESIWQKTKSLFIFIVIATVILASSPILSIHATVNHYKDLTVEKTKYEDLKNYFNGYNGCFVLYDSNANQYILYNKDQCEKRYSPDSTYKIYSALFGLEAGVISKNSSKLSWDGVSYPYDSWNRDQNLDSAMQNSVNWYFMNLDKKLGMDTLKKYFKQIKYGNVDLSSGISDYWMESSLLISPIEQVVLLKDFYNNKFGFHKDNIQTVKDALSLAKSNSSLLSGKTGTGNVNGKNINGWFIGYVEALNNTYFFATNIQNDDYSNGLTAYKITLSILKDKNIFISSNNYLQ